MTAQLKKDTGDKLARFHDLISFSHVSVWDSPIPIKGRNMMFTQKEEHPAVFNDMLVQRCLELYTKEGDLVIDPMSGTGTTAWVAKRMKRHSICFDIVQKYIDIGKRTVVSQRSISPELEKYNPEFRLCDARKLGLEDNSTDFIIFSPPYWDLYVYEDLPNQIGTIEKREDFDNAMFEVFKQCYRVLKQEKFCVCVISDIRKTQLIDLHNDISIVAKKAGFVLWDIVVNKRNIISRISRSHRASVMRGYSVRIHEYLMVFKKTVIEDEDMKE
jgi:DNA modification methylase